MSRPVKQARTNLSKKCKPFWERKSLEEMTFEEWESLCDGCGKCCLFKFEDKKTGLFLYSNTACKLLDTHTCLCISYENRVKWVKNCVVLTPRNAKKFHWLPETCAYRRLALGKPLPPWHPLISGDADLVHRLGLSVKGKAISENMKR